jgi:DNA replication protein DnaC
MTFETYEALNASCADAVVQCQEWCATHHRWTLTHKGDESPPSMGMVLSGIPGAGKTHLAASMVRRLTELGMHCLFIDIAEFLAGIRNTFDGGTTVVTVEQAIRAPLLVMDDLGAERETPWAVETMYVIISKRLSENRPMIFTTNLLHKDIADRADGSVSLANNPQDGSGLYLRRIYSRLREITGSLLVLDAPDYRATMN